MTFAVDPPAWVLLLLAAGVIVVATLAYARSPVPLTPGRRICLTSQRASVLALVVLCLLQPVALLPGARVQGTIPVLVDVSGSMTVTAGDAGRRLDRASQVVQTGLPAVLGPDLVLEPWWFGEDLRPAPSSTLVADDRWTDLAGALENLRDRGDGRAVPGIVLLSDGADTGDRDPAAVVDPEGPPIFVVPVALDRPRPDVALTTVSMAGEGVAGATVEVAATVVAWTDVAETVTLRLETADGLVDVRRVDVAGDGTPVRVVFDAGPAPAADTLHTVTVSRLAGETVLENNRRQLLVPATARPRRVLMVEGAPGYDHAFLKRTWSADAGIEVDAVVRKGLNDLGEPTFYIQAAPGRREALVSGFPPDRAALFVYDVLVLANRELASLTTDELALTMAFVEERGGGLLVLGSVTLTGDGAARSPLAPVLPLELDGRTVATRHGERDWRTDQPRLTDDGLVHPIAQLGTTAEETRAAWAELPRLGGSVALGAARPGATVLAEIAGPGGERRPLWAVQRFGRGRAMVFAGESVWRWKMLRPSEDPAYDRLWAQAVRWLAQDSVDPVDVRVADQQALGRPLQVDVDVRDLAFRPVTDARPTITWEAPGGVTGTTTATLDDGATGRYGAALETSAAGVYRLSVETTGSDGASTARRVERSVLVGGADDEWADPAPDREALARLAVASGGAVIGADALDVLAEQLRARHVVDVEVVTRGLWHNWWFFGVLMALLLTEWSVRRRWGLR